MFAQSRTYNRKFTLQKYEKKLISHLFDQLFCVFFILIILIGILHHHNRLKMSAFCRRGKSK